MVSPVYRTLGQREGTIGGVRQKVVRPEDRTLESHRRCGGRFTRVTVTETQRDTTSKVPVDCLENVTVTSLRREPDTSLVSETNEPTVEVV